MKKFTLTGACLILVGLAAASTFAQTHSTTTYVQSSAVVGAKIKDSRGEEVGEIKDFVLDRNTGCLAYVVLSTGQAETKTVAAPWSIFTVSSEPRVYVTRIERERIYSAPVWEASRVEEYTRTGYLSNVYGYFGVTVPTYVSQSSVGTSSTTTTGVSTSTGTGSSTGASGSPSMTAAPTAKPSPAASATAHPASSPLGTPEKTTAPRTGSPAATRPMSTRGESRDAREAISPSKKTEANREKESAEGVDSKSEKGRSESATKGEKTEQSDEAPSKSHPSKKRQHPSEQNPEAASTPR